MESPPLYTVEVTLAAGLDDEQASRFAESFLSEALSISVMRRADRYWQLQFLVAGQPDQDDLSRRIALQAAVMGLPSQNMPLNVRPVPDVNWLEESYRAFPPFRIGPFLVYGSHSHPDVLPGDLSLQIDAATAFGSGEHGTTAGCLLLLAALRERGIMPRSILDMGCGSGILAIAAARLWTAPVLAADIDPECVRVTALHVLSNAIGPQMETLCCDGFSAITGTYDLVIANILAGPLMEMADDLARCVNPGRYAVLSGMLQTQVDSLVSRYGACRMTITDRVDRDEWSAILLQKET